MSSSKSKKTKSIEAYIRLQVPAGSANPSPPIGPALGQKGVNIKAFCDAFNATTLEMPGIEKGTPLPVVISVFSDKSFTFIVKTPPTSFLLMKALGVAKGSSVPNNNKIGSLSKQQITDIAKKKMPDLNTTCIEAALKSVKGTARSMGIEITE